MFEKLEKNKQYEIIFAIEDKYDCKVIDFHNTSY
jgi:hypothetical protein